MIPKNDLEFRQSLSLSGVCQNLAASVETEVKKRCSKYCLVYQLRHVLDTGSPSIAMVSTDEKLAEELRQRNERLGFHTFNHVLDSLYYPDRLSTTPASGDTGFFIRVSYNLTESESCHLFDDLAHCRTNSVDSDVTDVIHYAHVGVRWEENLVNVQNWEQHTDLDTSELLFGNAKESDSSGATRLYEQYVCGAQKLCSKLGINPSIVAYRSIMAAVYQLGTYAHPGSSFGSEAITLLLRPRDHFGFAVGLTIISEEFISNQQARDIVAIVSGHFKSLQNGDLSPVTSMPDQQRLDALLHYYGLRYLHSRQNDIPAEVVSSISKKVLELSTEHGKQIPEDSPLTFRTSQQENTISQTVRSMLGIALKFCDEKLEGRSLQFGIVLGHAFLMRYWPGIKPVPATQAARISGRQEFFQLTDLPKQVHLLECPEERCLVIPYGNFSIDDREVLPAYVLELSEFTEALSSWSAGAMWSSELRPYAYLTARYPWAVAAVVGPGSEVRILVGGQIQAYRDGKGWRTYQEPASDIIAAAAEWRPPTWSAAQQAAHEDLLRSMIDLGIQISPIARRDSHGGLLVYAPLGEAPENWHSQAPFIQRLHDSEPERVGGSGKWLSGRNLLRRGKSGNTTGRSLDVTVAQLVLRASKLDGAIVLCDPDGHVKYFGRRLNYVTEDLYARGTKRLAAQSFVCEFGRKGLTWAIAIAISADGPLSIYTYSRIRSHYRETVVLGKIL